MDEYDDNISFYFEEDQIGLREEFQERVDEPMGFKVLVRIDNKNRVIVIHHFGLAGWYAA